VFSFILQIPSSLGDGRQICWKGTLVTERVLGGNLHCEIVVFDRIVLFNCSFDRQIMNIKPPAVIHFLSLRDSLQLYPSNYLINQGDSAHKRALASHASTPQTKLRIDPESASGMISKL
jgi:hypothetical protein